MRADSVCQLLSRVRLSATPWTVAHQAPLSMEFYRQEHWSGLPFPSPEDLPDPGIKPGSPALQANSLPLELQGRPSLHPLPSLISNCLNLSIGTQGKIMEVK